MFKNYSACLPRLQSAGIIPRDATPTTPKEMFGWVLGFSDKLEISIFKKTIKNWIHHSRNVERMNAKGQYIIKELFSAYLRTPQLLPDGSVLHFLVDTNEYYLSRIWRPSSSDPTKIQEERELERKKYANLDSARDGGIGAARADFTERLKGENVYLKCVLMRRICDHIASMTDRYATEEYQKIYG
jgi:dGTP triphosphohydrolase